MVKVLLILGLASAAALVLRGRTSATRLAMVRLGASAMLVIGVGAVLYPGGVTTVAQAVGVGRGADLVLYVFVVAFLLVSVGFYRKLQDLEDRYVALVRQLALAQADLTLSQDPEDVGCLADLPATRENIDLE